MSSSDWEEVKRLAADFQRAQLTSSLQKLSERNCIEIINKLLELNLLEIFHTSNGKEYLTLPQLIKEVKDELFVHGGRINLIDISSILAVDLGLLESCLNKITSSLPGVQVVVGQLVSSQYLDNVAEEVNEKLQQEGSIAISDIAKQYDLPGNYIHEHMTHRLGNIIQGQQDEHDSHTFFTDAYVASHRARIQGVLSAITRPTTVSSIISQYGFQERLFFSIAEKLINLNRIAGTLTGGRQAKKAIYVPDIYSKSQNEWVDNFLKQNGYLEFEALKRLGISEPASYIQKRFEKESLIMINELAIGQSMIDQVEAALDEALISGGYADIYHLLPSNFNSDVGGSLIGLCLKKREDKKSTTNAQIFCDTIVVSEQIIVKLNAILERLMPTKAKEALDKGVFKQQVSNEKVKLEDDSGKNKREDRRKKAAGGKQGGGTQGRETKTKSTKNKHKGRRGGGHDSDSDDDSVGSKPPSGNKFPVVEFLSLNELYEEISKLPELEDCPEELIEEIASSLQDPLTKKFQEVVKTAFLATVAAGGDSRKKTHQQLQEKVSTLLISIKLAEKGAKLFQGDLYNQLMKHLLKTYCSEVVNELVCYLADESLIDLTGNKEITPDMRLKIITKLADDVKEPLITVHKALSSSVIEDFNNAIDDAIAAADLMIKKKDNKKDRQVLLNHRSGLIEQLEGSTDSALSLHLTCLILFHSVSGQILHASGRFVPQIINYFRDHLPREQYEVLHEFQVLVMKSLTLKSDDDEMSSVNRSLEELTPTIKNVAVTYKKSSSS